MCECQYLSAQLRQNLCAMKVAVKVRDILKMLVNRRRS